MQKEVKTITVGAEVGDLLKKLLVLQLFQLGVSQAEIGRRVKLDINEVNGLLKGIRVKKIDGKK